MRPTHFLQRRLHDGEVQRIAFAPAHYRAMGLMPAMSAGFPELEAHHLVNKMNVSQAHPQRYVFGLETDIAYSVLHY